ncbi:Cytochrome P450 107B1 [Actinomadura madurae]|nr:Cytochrome P450 107B1 [Actinomadura madurae]
MRNNQEVIYTDAFFRDPHPVYARLREEAPVLKMKDPNGLAYWLITRYDEARAALADERLSKDPRRAWDALRAAGIVSGEPQDATFDLHSVDPPEHTRLRDLVTRAFTPGRVAGLEPRVREITDGLLDAMAAGDTADLIGDFAYPLSLTVISELVGVPAPDLDDFRVWVTAALTPRFVRDPVMSREEGGRRLREYVTDLVAAKAAAERADAPDLLSALLTAHERDGRLSSAEVVALTQQLLFAGHEPTTNLIGNGMAALFRNPDQLRLLRDRPDLLPAAIEELLRYDGPTARASPRYAVEDIEIGGVTIPEGAVVIVGLAAANRDPGAFDDPDRLDLTRDGRAHVAFGHGIHRCLGVPLARLEGRIALGSLLARFPGIALDRPHDELAWLPFPVFRGLRSLPVRLTGR